MMVRDRRLLAAALGLGLGLGLAAPARGQQAPPSPKPRAAHRAKAVQPAQGPAPDQAVVPDVSSQVPAGPQEQFPDPPPPAEPAPQPAPEPAPEPAPTPEATTPVTDPPLAATPPSPIQTVSAPTPPPAPPPVPAKTPEGRRLQKETAILLQLAQDLKAEIEKAGGNTLSVVALRKADQIQKMSKDLKQEMSQQEQGTAGK